MIDLHSHVLPGLDDGAQDMKEALAMCLAAAKDGVTHLVATPHYQPEDPGFTMEQVAVAVERINDALAKRGVGLTLEAGAEVMMSPRLLDLAREGLLPTLGRGGRYVLLEMPPQAAIRGLDELVFQLGLLGLAPIIAHPERTWSGRDNWNWLEDLVRQGCLVQITAMSLTGAFGSQPKRTAERLARLGLCHLVASDAHSARHRPPVLSGARKHLVGLWDEPTAQSILEVWPEQVLAGEPVDPELPKARRRLLGIFG